MEHVAIIRCTKRQMSIKLNAALYLPAQAPRCPIKKCLVSLRGAQCTFRTKCTKRPTKSEKDPPKAQKTHQKHKRPTKTEMSFSGPTKTEMFFKRPTKKDLFPSAIAITSSGVGARCKNMSNMVLGQAPAARTHLMSSMVLG